MHTHFEMAVHARTLNDVGVAVLFFDTRFAAAVEAHRADMKSVRFFVAIGPNAPNWAIAYEALMSQGDIGDPALDADESEICAIQFTTGTTDSPSPGL